MSSGSGSSAVSSEFVSGKKLVVHLAENGHTFEFGCDGDTLIGEIQLSIESLYGVRVTDQLLLCGNASLQPQHPLSHYKLPRDDCEVFLYNKAHLLSDKPCPAVETIDVPVAAVPSRPSPSQDTHPLDNAADPSLKALAMYEREFRYHFQFANALYNCTCDKLEICNRLLREQQVQERALAMARGNLEHTFQKLKQRYADFVKCYSQQHRHHSDLLASFGSDVERLRSVKLHPSIQSESRKCLLDFVKEDDLRKWFEICSDSQRQFVGKVSQLRLKFAELEKRVENVLSGLSSSSSKDLELAIKNYQKIISKQRSIMQSLSKDVNTVKKHVDNCLSFQPSASVRPHDAVSALGPMYDAHEKNIPEVQTCEHEITELLERCKSKKNEMNLLVHISMQHIKSVQFGIRDMMNELHAFQEVIGHQRKEFENIKFVNGIGHAYRACLAEIVRRKSSLKLYMGLAGQLAERLAAEREAEIRRREGFFKAWSKYIPHDILASMGLFDSPSQAIVNVSPFDTNLIEIEVSDVDRFAPNFSMGLLSKFERSELQRSSLVTSGNSRNLVKAEDSLLDTCDKRDSEELLDVFHLVEIAGTNKLELENAQLKADLASATALICMFNIEIGYDTLDEGKLGIEVKTLKDKTVEALHSKDEYGKHLQSMLDRAQTQCLSYEKRIQELEQRFSDPFVQGLMLSSSKYDSESILSTVKADGYKSEVSGDGEAQMPYKSTVSMGEASCSSEEIYPKLDQTAGHPCKPVGGDENMTDLLAVALNIQDSAGISMDTSMGEPPREEHQVGDSDEHKVADTSEDLDSDITKEVKAMTSQLSLTVTCTSDASTRDPLKQLPCGTAAEDSLESKCRDAVIVELQSALADKLNQCSEVENKLKAAAEEISGLRRDLDINMKLLDESQMNCAHLENCLHEAREEAHTNLCAADRRASEYNAVRASAIRMRSLFERFRSCVTSVAVTNFAESLRSLALSLASSVNEDGDDGTAEFQKCIMVLGDKVSLLSRHRTELLDHRSRAEAANGRLRKELEEKNELITSLYAKHQFEKQANKEKISVGRLQVHELAAFVLNSAGHYEAINRISLKYYLSTELVALFTERSSCRPSYIIGQIVHIERQVVRLQESSRPKHGDQSSPLDSTGQLSSRSALNSNPYDLPVGREYFVVTVAMLPDTIHSHLPDPASC